MEQYVDGDVVLWNYLMISTANLHSFATVVELSNVMKRWRIHINLLGSVIKSR